MIEIIIPGNPVPKKNSQQIRRRRNGQTFIAPSERFLAYQAQAGTSLIIPVGLADKFPIDYPVNVRCIYYRKNKIRCDLTNLLEATDDVLVHYGILADDNFKIVSGHDGSRVYIDAENPRAEITITKMEV